MRIYLTLLALCSLSFSWSTSGNESSFPQSSEHVPGVVLLGVIEPDEKLRMRSYSGTAQYQLLIARPPLAPFENLAIGEFWLESSTGKRYEAHWSSLRRHRIAEYDQIYSYRAYSFNIPVDEFPKAIHWLSSDDYIVVPIKKLLSTPRAIGERKVRLGENFQVKDFMASVVSLEPVGVVQKGPYGSNKYGIFKPRPGYKFLLFTLLVQNKGLRKQAPPMSPREGSFEFELKDGRIYDDLYSGFHLLDEVRLVGSRKGKSPEIPELKEFAFSIESRQFDKIVKVIEIPKDGELSEIRFNIGAPIRVTVE